jgi:hypothetical protein
MISFPFLVHTASAHGRTAHTRCGRCGSAWMWPRCAASRSDRHVAVPRIGSDARIPTHGHPGGTQQALRTPTRPPRRHGTITTSVVHPDTSTVPPQGKRGQGAQDPTWDRPRRNPAMSGTQPAHHTLLGGPSDAAPLPASSRTDERLRHAPAVPSISDAGHHECLRDTCQGQCLHVRPIRTRTAAPVGPGPREHARSGSS